MDNVQINLYGVLLAGLSSMVIGAVYYADWAFGKQWKKLAKVDQKRFEKEMPRIMPALFVAALATSFVVAYFSFLYHSFFQDSWLGASVLTSLVLWLGVSVTSLFVHNALEQRPARLTYLSLGNRLLSIVVMGLIVGWLHP